jgi:hypothetical protein
MLEILLIWTLNVFFVFTADMTIGVPPVDLYDSNDRAEFEIFDLIIFFIGYPPFAYLALNYYKPKVFTAIKTTIFIIICALSTTLFEWLALLADVFSFKGWKIYMSFLTYLVIYGFNISLTNHTVQSLRLHECFMVQFDSLVIASTLFE